MLVSARAKDLGTLRVAVRVALAKNARWDRFVVSAVVGLVLTLATVVVSVLAGRHAGRLFTFARADAPYGDPSIYALVFSRSFGQRVYTATAPYPAGEEPALNDPARTPREAATRFWAHGESISNEPFITWAPGTGHVARSFQINGWPFPSLWGEHEFDSRGGAVVRGGVVLRSGDILPLRPSAVGMSVNVLLFGTAAWGSVSLAAFALACRRARGGRCAACGYDLRSDRAGVCPECGWNDPVDR